MKANCTFLNFIVFSLLEEKTIILKKVNRYSQKLIHKLRYFFYNTNRVWKKYQFCVVAEI
jgi:hypothetical protein